MALFLNMFAQKLVRGEHVNSIRYLYPFLNTIRVAESHLIYRLSKGS